MRIGAISDVHSDARSLEDALSDMGDVDLLVCAGDFVGYGREPNEVVERLHAIVSHAVQGNHDAAVVSSGPESGYWAGWMNSRAWKLARENSLALTDENTEYLRNLPLSDRFEVDGASVLLVHGSPINPLEHYVFRRELSERILERWFPDGDRPDVIIHGHTHEPYTALIGSTRFVNPGSTSLPRTDQGRSYAVIDVKDRISAAIEYLEPRLVESY